MTVEKWSRLAIIMVKSMVLAKLEVLLTAEYLHNEHIADFQWRRCRNYIINYVNNIAIIMKFSHYNWFKMQIPYFLRRFNSIGSCTIDLHYFCCTFICFLLLWSFCGFKWIRLYMRFVSFTIVSMFRCSSLTTIQLPWLILIIYLYILEYTSTTEVSTEA